MKSVWSSFVSAYSNGGTRSRIGAKTSSSRLRFATERMVGHIAEGGRGGEVPAIGVFRLQHWLCANESRFQILPCAITVSVKIATIEHMSPICADVSARPYLDKITCCLFSLDLGASRLEMYQLDPSSCSFSSPPLSADIREVR